MRDIDFFTKLLSLKRPWKVDRVSLSSVLKEILGIGHAAVNLFLENQGGGRSGCHRDHLPGNVVASQ
jgi:hypothetical protein